MSLPILKYKTKTDSIRIRHSTFKGVMMILRDLARPLSKSNLRPVCDVCTVVHTFKTYHLLLDDEGCILVSTGVWDHIEKMFDKGGFEIANIIHNPPTQILKPRTVKIEARAIAPGQVVKEA